MSVPELTFYKGIPIEDHNFTEFPDRWTDDTGGLVSVVGAGPIVAESLVSANMYGHPWGSGVSLLVDTTTMGVLPAANVVSQCITSDLTPYGLGCKTSGSGGTYTQNIWFGIIARANAGTISNILRLTLVEVDEDGNEIAYTVTQTFLGSADLGSWGLFDTYKTGSSLQDETRQFKLRIHFGNSATGNLVNVDWVGLGIGWTSSSNYQTIGSNFYMPGISWSTNSGMRFTGNPHVTGRRAQVVGRGEMYQVMNLWWERMTEENRNRLQAMLAWHRGGSTYNVDHQPWQHTRGTDRPIIVVPDRDGMKRAFYAALPQFTSQQSLRWFAENAGRYGVPLTFEEWLN